MSTISSRQIDSCARITRLGKSSENPLLLGSVTEPLGLNVLSWYVLGLDTQWTGKKPGDIDILGRRLALPIQRTSRPRTHAYNRNIRACTRLGTPVCRKDTCKKGGGRPPSTRTGSWAWKLSAPM